MPDPVVVQRALAFRADLLRRESVQMRAMAASWRQVERNLEESIRAVLAEIAQREAAGEVFGRGMGPYSRLDRYQDLLRQVRSEFARFSNEAATTITEGMVETGSLGVQHSAVQTALALQQAELAAQFNRLNRAAVENIVAVLQQDAPVGDLLRRAWPGGFVRMIDALTNGVALGWNPRKTERAMREAGRSVLQRALLIARTEQLRSYRTASIENYRASGIVKGYKRLASKSPRTCLACLMADGTFYELDQSFDAHPNCRCTLVPVLWNDEAPEWETGRTWFGNQPEARQRGIMGDAAYEAWRGGAVALDDLVERHEHPVWGASLQVKSLRRALGDSGGVTGQAQSAIPPQTPPTLTAEDVRSRLIAFEDSSVEKLAALKQQMDEITEKTYRAGYDERQQLKQEHQKLAKEYDAILQPMRELLYVENPTTVDLNIGNTVDADVAGKWRDGAYRFGRMIDQSLLPDGATVKVQAMKSGRAHYNPVKKAIHLSTEYDGQASTIHELGHWLEDHNTDVLDKLLDFYKRRTKNESLRWLGKGYPRNEVTRKDDFIHPYMGKDYNGTATEILSMGMEILYRNPAKLAKEDPDFFDFMFNLLRGR